MSVSRIFQGMNNWNLMQSQIAGQVIRYIWMLLATFIIMKLGSGINSSVITFAAFAAGSRFCCLAVLYKEGM